MRHLLTALRFLTILPLPGGQAEESADRARSVPCFPVVGLLLGALAAGTAWALARPGMPGPVLAAGLTLLLAAFSGGLHLDGLSDTADGFLSARPRERILEIMKDSHVGAMGVIAIAGVLLFKFSALLSLPPGRLWQAALLMPLTGRCMMVLNMAALPYVRANGLGSAFARGPLRPAAAGALALQLAAGIVVLGAARGTIVAGAALLVAALFAAWCRRKIGGATGDTYGAVCELTEIVPALVLACVH